MKAATGYKSQTRCQSEERFCVVEALLWAHPQSNNLAWPDMWYIFCWHFLIAITVQMFNCKWSSNLLSNLNFRKSQQSWCQQLKFCKCTTEIIKAMTSLFCLLLCLLFWMTIRFLMPNQQLCAYRAKLLFKMFSQNSLKWAFAVVRRLTQCDNYFVRWLSLWETNWSTLPKITLAAMVKVKVREILWLWQIHWRCFNTCTNKSLTTILQSELTILNHRCHWSYTVSTVATGDSSGAHVPGHQELSCDPHYTTSR